MTSIRLYFLLSLLLPMISGAKTKKPRLENSEDKQEIDTPDEITAASVSKPYEYGEIVPLPPHQLPAYNSPHLRHPPQLYHQSLSSHPQHCQYPGAQISTYSLPGTSNKPLCARKLPIYRQVESSVSTTATPAPRNRERKLREVKEAGELDEFEQLQALCKNGQYHKIPLDWDLFADRDPSDYLGLAIRAHDAEAIKFCKDMVVLESSSAYLQSAIIDAIVRDETDIVEALGQSFPSIFTTIYAFHPPYDYLSGTSLIRIAVDQNKPKAAKAMLKFIPVAMIGDFWKTIDSMKKFIVAALHTGDINLTPTVEGDTAIDPKALAEMYYTCVLEGDFEAMAYLLTNTDVPVDTLFTGENGMTISAMFMAAHVGNSGIVKYLYNKCPALARVPNSMGMLPIHMAAGNGHMDVIKILSAESDTLTTEVTISGIKYTPFSLAIRNKKQNVADLIISFIKDQDNTRIQKEMTGLAYWAILDDNVSFLDIYFDFNKLPSSGRVDEEYNLLEMAILGIIDPKRGGPKRSAASPSVRKGSSKKCVDRLIDEWNKHKLPFTIHHEGVISGSILGLVYPNDLDVFESLVSRAKIDPNAPILITTGTGTLRTTYLNRIISLGATGLVPYAISRGCDPRILDSDGNDAIAVATKYKNAHVLDYFRQIYALNK